MHDDKELDILYCQDVIDAVARDIRTVEANRFASTLLMPRELVIKLWKQYKEQNIILIVKEMSRQFNISNENMKWRIHHIGLEKYINLVD